MEKELGNSLRVVGIIYGEETWEQLLHTMFYRETFNIKVGGSSTCLTNNMQGKTKEGAQEYGYWGLKNRPSWLLTHALTTKLL